MEEANIEINNEAAGLENVVMAPQELSSACMLLGANLGHRFAIRRMLLVNFYKCTLICFTKIEEMRKKTKLGHKIWLPEEMNLAPSDDNGEQYSFWFVKFEAYLKECNIVADEDKFSKLKSRLSYSVFQHVVDTQEYESMVQALKDLFIKKRNRHAAGNNLITCRQNVGEPLVILVG